MHCVAPVPSRVDEKAISIYYLISILNHQIRNSDKLGDLLKIRTNFPKVL